MEKIEVPEWLTKEYIKTALENGNKGSIMSIDKIEINLPVPKGNNYISTIYGVNVYYKINNKKELSKISLIIKVPSAGEYITKMGFQEKEFQVYNCLLPKYLSYFKDKWGDLTAKSYYSIKKNVIVLEDLKDKGYIMVDRIKRLDLDHCKVALSSLAKFHAASVKYYEIDPGLIRRIGKESIFRNDLKEQYDKFMNSAIYCLIDVCKNHRSNLNKYSDKIKEFSEKLWDFVLEMIKPKEGDFNVINHGDYWTTNMMFKYIDNKPINVIPIDFQISRFASPIYDILYFLHTSVQEDILSNNLDQLLNIYLNNLNKYLEYFGTDIRLSKMELIKNLDKHEYFGVYVVIILLPIMLADPNKGKLMDFKESKIDDMENNAAMYNYYTNEIYLNIIENRFKKFDIKGWYIL